MERKQLTLFINDEDIENIRAKFNPIQHTLIAAHVTLCRENEIEDLPKVIRNIKNLVVHQPLHLTFTEVERFEDGRGVLIPGSHDNNEFHHLRRQILNSSNIHQPHITLMHPRNSTCNDAIFEEIKLKQLPKKIDFYKISLISQIDGGKWQILQEFPLC